jgi:hypothetical protein
VQGTSTRSVGHETMRRMMERLYPGVAGAASLYGCGGLHGLGRWLAAGCDQVAQTAAAGALACLLQLQSPCGRSRAGTLRCQFCASACIWFLVNKCLGCVKLPCGPMHRGPCTFGQPSYGLHPRFAIWRCAQLLCRQNIFESPYSHCAPVRLTLAPLPAPLLCKTVTLTALVATCSHVPFARADWKCVGAGCTSYLFENFCGHSLTCRAVFDLLLGTAMPGMGRMTQLPRSMGTNHVSIQGS